mmetsp:Transcript_5647/g.8677  ORF Transcript_5647/g.8677 Transcript_5647/m.8677 type:complete len:90 (-) Transcript_5647:1937-2206(-)
MSFRLKTVRAPATFTRGKGTALPTKVCAKDSLGSFDPSMSRIPLAGPLKKLPAAFVLVQAWDPGFYKGDKETLVGVPSACLDPKELGLV